jgi:hypothetical protein
MPDWLVVLLIVTNVVTLAALYLATRRMLKLRRQRRRAFAFRSYPIRQVKLEEIDPCFAMTEHGPAPESTVSFIGGEGVVASLSDRETWVIAGLAKSARQIFEFGTCSGKTAHVMALNAPDDAEVHTLTIHPDDLASLEFSASDDKHHQDAAADEAAFTTFYYQGHPTEAKIRQIFSDSKAYDEAPLMGSVDLVFIDGAHTRTYVESDTAKAMAMLSERGVVLWHDYKPDAPDVFDYLNTLAGELSLVHIKDTDIVMYRRG